MEKSIIEVHYQGQPFQRLDSEMQWHIDDLQLIANTLAKRTSVRGESWRVTHLTYYFDADNHYMIFPSHYIKVTPESSEGEQ